MKKLATIALCALLLNSCDSSTTSSLIGILGSLLGDTDQQVQELSGTIPTLMELPAIGRGDVIVTHTGFTLSYNSAARIPEWVAYELTADETRGEAERDEIMFRMDPDLEGGQAMREDYSNSGWTKGHMACAGDFHWDEDAMAETFYLSNICPQDEDLNGGDWNYLEKQVRRWARDYGRVWVVSGPIIGTGKYGTIGERDVVVPDSFFKAVLVQNKGKFHSIAFVMDNDDRRYYLSDCAMSVDELEELTGLDFFPALSDDVEKTVESKYDFGTWGITQR